MYAQVEKPKKNKSRAVANPAIQNKRTIERSAGFMDRQVIQPVKINSYPLVYEKVSLKAKPSHKFHSVSNINGDLVQLQKNKGVYLTRDSGNLRDQQRNKIDKYKRNQIVKVENDQVGETFSIVSSDKNHIWVKYGVKKGWIRENAIGNRIKEKGKQDNLFINDNIFMDGDQDLNIKVEDGLLYTNNGLTLDQAVTLLDDINRGNTEGSEHWNSLQGWEEFWYHADKGENEKIGHMGRTEKTDNEIQDIVKSRKRELGVIKYSGEKHGLKLGAENMTTPLDGTDLVAHSHPASSSALKLPKNDWYRIKTMKIESIRNIFPSGWDLRYVAQHPDIKGHKVITPFVVSNEGKVKNFSSGSDNENSLIWTISDAEAIEEGKIYEATLKDKFGLLELLVRTKEINNAPTIDSFTVKKEPAVE